MLCTRIVFYTTALLVITTFIPHTLACLCKLIKFKVCYCYCYYCCYCYCYNLLLISVLPLLLVVRVVSMPWMSVVVVSSVQKQSCRPVVVLMISQEGVPVVSSVLKLVVSYFCI